MAKYTALSITVPPMVKEFVHTFAKENGRTMSDVVEEAIQMFRFAQMSNKADFADSKSVIRGNQIILDLRKKQPMLNKQEKERIKKDEERKKQYYEDTKHLDNITGMVKNAEPERPTNERQPDGAAVSKPTVKKTK